jgi:hypothetical protein
MKTLLKNKVKFLMLIFLALSFTANSVPVIKSNTDSGSRKHEFRSLKGQCKCYKQKVYYMPNKHNNSQKKGTRSNR